MLSSDATCSRWSFRVGFVTLSHFVGCLFYERFVNIFIFLYFVAVAIAVLCRCVLFFFSGFFILMSFLLHVGWTLVVSQKPNNVDELMEQKESHKCIKPMPVNKHTMHITRYVTAMRVEYANGPTTKR